MSSDTTVQQPKNGPPKFLLDAASAVNQGQHDKAIEIFKQNIETDRFIAYSGIGDVYRAKGQYVEAFNWLKKAYEYNPNALNVIESMGLVLSKLNRNEEAAQIMCKALQLQKTNVSVRLLAEAMRKQGMGKQAAETLEKMIPTSKIKLDLMFELAMLYERINQNEEAEKLYHKLIKLVPHQIVYGKLGHLYMKSGRMTDAAANYKKSLELAPNDTHILNLLAITLIKSGQILEASKIMEDMVRKGTIGIYAHTAYLYHLHLLPEIDLNKIFLEHKHWADKHAPISLANSKHDNNPDPNRKLRIGYISPDFRHHPVGFILEYILREHNLNEFEIYGYGNVELPDDNTQKLMKMLYKYRNIFGVNDDAVAKVIREDQIDILVDLAGHTINHRLLTLARKPAPIQATYLGYFDTTGMQQVDYIITDEMLTPADSQKYFTEQFAYLPGGVCFYHPFKDFEISPAPIIKNGYPTFGVFTNNLRFNSKLLQTWAEIIKNIPNSKLMIAFDGGDDPSVQATFLKDFEKLGVSKNSISFTGRKIYELYMQQYGLIDIFLDTFPENGGTTTGDCLWMGVPVISYYASHMNGRVGLTILNRVGMDEFAVPSIEQYIAKAVELGKNPERIVEIRNSLRPIMKNSRLCDSAKMTREVETCYRQMWHKWCKNKV
ncbi:MAG: tetratricopeptide repeat protein [Phycisphaerales bacterium]